MFNVILIALLAAAVLLAGRMIRAWLQYRGERVVTCPETHQAAGVALNAKRGLAKCSRWPERQDCGQECRKQIEESPDHCLVRAILTRWYQDKNCSICGKPIGEIHWADHRPALLSPERLTVEWFQVRPENIPAVLEDHAAVCWNCNIVQTFCREHPGMVVDRSRSARQ